ncbi:MAG: hypothetical protein MK289_11145 [Trichodesmium sp. ALOHA_ZT_67]|nr:hypothetical protein [Trichodesmium sp. ALOHA_ZT_67]MDT9340796.1 hypothetical protein [Trichodesmium erythraeum 21-75]
MKCLKYGSKHNKHQNAATDFVESLESIENKKIDLQEKERLMPISSIA